MWPIGYNQSTPSELDQHPSGFSGAPGSNPCPIPTAIELGGLLEIGRPRAGLIILPGKVKAVLSIAEPLIVGMDNGVVRAMVPLSNDEFIKVPDLIEPADLNTKVLGRVT